MSSDKRSIKKAAKEAARVQAEAAHAALIDEAESVPEFREDCPCKKEKCERHGKCHECYLFHHKGKLMPFCRR